MRGLTRTIYTPSEERTQEHTIEHSEPSSVVESVRFGFMTDEDVRKHSVVKITNPIFMSKKERTIPGGLYCQEMGPLGDNTNCQHCGLHRSHCRGHCGHIELVFPIYHPLKFNLLYNFFGEYLFLLSSLYGRKERCNIYLISLI